MSALPYLDSGRFDASEIRAENAVSAEANRLNALALIAEERKFWTAKLNKAATQAEVKSIREELDKLTEMETQHVA